MLRLFLLLTIQTFSQSDVTNSPADNSWLNFMECETLSPDLCTTHPNCYWSQFEGECESIEMESDLYINPATGESSIVMCNQLSADPTGCANAQGCYYDEGECDNCEPEEAMWHPHCPGSGATASTGTESSSSSSSATASSSSATASSAMMGYYFDCDMYEFNIADCNNSDQCWWDGEECESIYPTHQKLRKVAQMSSMTAMGDACEMIPTAQCIYHTPFCELKEGKCEEADFYVIQNTGCLTHGADQAACVAAQCTFNTVLNSCVSGAEYIVETEQECEMYRFNEAGCKSASFKCMWDGMKCRENELEQEEYMMMNGLAAQSFFSQKDEIAAQFCSQQTAATCQTTPGCIYMLSNCLSWEMIDMLQKTQEQSTETTNDPNTLALLGVGILGCLAGVGLTLLPRLCRKNNSLDDILLDTQGNRLV